MPTEFIGTPWRVSVHFGGLLILDREGCMVAQVGSSAGAEVESVRRNALVIAQAPRLLKHLEKAHRVLAAVGRRIPTTPEIDEMMDAMQRAIGDAGGSTE